MTLEPTDEQLEPVRRVIDETWRRGTEHEGVRIAFTLIRDLVLEEAAKKLEEDYTSNTGVPWPGSLGFVARIRGLKGTP